MKMPKANQKGFTLIELMTSVAIFTMVMFISIGSILGVFDANRKTKAIKAVLNNLNLALEDMSKEMRYGENYHCGSSGALTSPQNCPAGDSFMSFLSSGNNQISYRHNGSGIEKQVDTGEFVPITAPDANIESLTFYTLGAGTGDSLQPKTVIIIKGHVGSGASESNFALETLVSQRALDR